jgi:hypothetical protein
MAVSRSLRARETTARRKSDRLGLRFVKRREQPAQGITATYGLKDSRGWVGELRDGMTLRQVEVTLAERDTAPKKQRLDWRPIMEQARAIVESYDTKVTLRQLFYQLVSRQLIPNEQTKYSYLSSKTAEARRDGWFPDLIDQTSEILVVEHFTSPEEAKRDLRQRYRRDRTEGQEVTIYLAVEKAGIQNQLWSWFGDMGLPILALGGYGSQTYKDEVRWHVSQQVYDHWNGERVADLDNLCHDDPRPAVLIYAGDHDASGDDIFRDFVIRTDPHARINDDYTGVTRSRLWLAVHRIALTKE